MENKEIKIYLAAPRGFCAGVVRAIDIVEKALKKYTREVKLKTNMLLNIANTFTDPKNKPKSRSNPFKPIAEINLEITEPTILMVKKLIKNIKIKLIIFFKESELT